MIGLAKAAHEYKREAPKQMSWLGKIGHAVQETVTTVVKNTGKFFKNVGRGIGKLFGF